MDSQSQRQFFHSFITNRVIVYSELDHIALIIHENLGQKFTAQRSDSIVHEIEELDGVDFFDIIANRSYSFILEIDFPESDFL
jgi:hypothetical protein